MSLFAGENSNFFLCVCVCVCVLFDESGNEVIVVRRLTFHEMVARCLIGLLCSLWPEWNPYAWYPEPPPVLRDD